MRRARGIAITVLVACASAGLPAGSAYGAGPPTGGCGEGFELTSIADLQLLSPGFDFSISDVNGDGLLCNRFLPDAAGGGIVIDNTTQHRR